MKLARSLALAAVPGVALLACTSFGSEETPPSPGEDGGGGADAGADAAPPPPMDPADAGAGAAFCAAHLDPVTTLFCADFESGGVAPFGFPTQNGPSSAFSLVTIGPYGKSLQVAVSRTGGAASLADDGLFVPSAASVQVDYDVTVVASSFSSITAGAVQVAGAAVEQEYGLGCYDGTVLSRSRMPGSPVAAPGWHHVTITLRTIHGGFQQQVVIDSTMVDSRSDDLSGATASTVGIGVEELGAGLPGDTATVVFDNFLVQKLP